MSATVVVIESPKIESPQPDHNVPTIFVLTCLFLGKEGTETPRKVVCKRTRTWGWYPTLERATKAAVDNETDMYEMGYYNAVVIEEFPWGTLAGAIAEHWFEVEYESEEGTLGTYKVTPLAQKPPVFENIVGFAW